MHSKHAQLLMVLTHADVHLFCSRTTFLLDRLHTAALGLRCASCFTQVLPGPAAMQSDAPPEQRVPMLQRELEVCHSGSSYVGVMNTQLALEKPWSSTLTVPRPGLTPMLRAEGDGRAAGGHSREG